MPEQSESAVKKLGMTVAFVTGVLGLGLHFVQPRESCQKYQEGRPFDVACNIRTEPGYYWRKIGRVGDYGAYGLGNTGDLPVCGRRGGTNARAQAGLWIDEGTLRTTMMRYCRNFQDRSNDSCQRPDQGPPTREGDSTIGIFEVECREMPLFRNPFE